MNRQGFRCCLAAACLLAAGSGCAPAAPEVGPDETTRPRFDGFSQPQLPASAGGGEGLGDQRASGFSPGVPLGTLSGAGAGTDSAFENRGFESRLRQEDLESQPVMQKFERHFKKGEFAAALATIEPLVRERPDDPGILFGAAATHRAAGDSVRAAPLLERVIALAPEHVAARKLLCIILTEQGRTAAAVAQLAPLFEAGTADAEVFALQAAARLRAGNVAEAEADADRSLELDPQMYKALLVRSAIRLKQGELDRAREDLLAARRAGAPELNCAPLSEELLRRTAARQEAAKSSSQQ